MCANISENPIFGTEKDPGGGGGGGDEGFV